MLSQNLTVKMLKSLLLRVECLWLKQG